MPVYNVEKYLRQCLDSIVGQTFGDLEIILINDGSKDGSLEIIREYAEKDQRIKVIDKPNEGYGKTMNRGIEAASGEYIGIVESDEWIEPDMYETLYGIAKLHNVDVVKSTFIPFDSETGKARKVSTIRGNTECVINPRQRPAVFYAQTSIWSAIYKREFLNKNNIRFLETPGASYQDVAFNFKIWAMADTAYLTTKPLVHYRVGHSSQSVQSKDKVFCVCDELMEIERYMASCPVRFRGLENIFNQVRYNVCFWNLKRLDGENKEMFRQWMQEQFIPVLKRSTMDMPGIDSKNKLRLLKLIYPKSIWLKVLYVLYSLTRCLTSSWKT